MHWVPIVMITVISVSYSIASESKELSRNKRYLWPVRTVTQTSTVSVTQSTSKVLVCAKLVNVSGPCRRRRSNWQEEPIILTFDDETHSLAERLQPSLSGYRIEPTVVAEMTNDGSMPGLESRNAGHVIEPSTRDPSDDFQEEEDEAESKFLNKHLQNLFSLKLFRTRVVVTYTTVTQIIYTATSTKTFFIQKCTPSPFYFELCNRRRQIDLSTTEV